MTKDQMKDEIKKMTIKLYRRMYENKMDISNEVADEKFKAWSIANMTATKLGIIINYTEEKQ